MSTVGGETAFFFFFFSLRRAHLGGSVCLSGFERGGSEASLRRVLPVFLVIWLGGGLRTVPPCHGL